MHPSITVDRIVRMVKRGQRTDTFPGVCLACGKTAKQPCEPDAEHYPCAYCKRPEVYGAEHVLFMVHA